MKHENFTKIKNYFFMHIIKQPLLIAAALMLLTPSYSSAGAFSRAFSIFDNYFIDVGLSVKELSLDVYEDGGNDSLGTLTTSFEKSFAFSAGSPFRYVMDSPIGYNLMFGFSNFKLESQQVDAKDTNLGTSTTGNYIYATPTLFFNVGDKKIENGKGHALKVGFGAGLGYLKADGDIIFTNAAPTVKHDIDIDNFSLASGFLLDYRFKRLALHASIAGPEISGDNYDYFFYDYSISIAYSFGVKEGVNKVKKLHSKFKGNSSKEHNHSFSSQK